MWKLQDFYLKFPLLIKVIPNVCVCLMKVSEQQKDRVTLSSVLWMISINDKT